MAKLPGQYLAVDLLERIIVLPDQRSLLLAPIEPVSEETGFVLMRLRLRGLAARLCVNLGHTLGIQASSGKILRLLLNRAGGTLYSSTS